MGVTRFEDLIAWQKARVLTRAVYQETRKGELARDLDLVRQIRRAAVSVMSNIAEGFERNRRREFHQYLSTAKASCAEVRSLLYVALVADYLTSGRFQVLMDVATGVGRITGGLRASVATERAHSALSTQHPALVAGVPKVKVRRG